MHLFFATLGFLTRIPIPKNTPVLPNEEFKKGIVYYPMIGLITGLIMAAIFILMDGKTTRLPAAIMVVFAQAAVSGGFHLDGLSDSFDGLFSARKKEEMLVIMRDSRVGTFGVLGLFFILLMKISAIYSLPGKEALLAVLLYPVVGKTITPLLMRSAYARSENGLGSIYLNPKYTFHMLFAILFGTAMIAFMLQEKGAIALAVSALVAVLFRRYCQKILGGMTGDTLGCGVEISEALFLLTLLYTRRIL